MHYGSRRFMNTTLSNGRKRLLQATWLCFVWGSINPFSTLSVVIPDNAPGLGFVNTNLTVAEQGGQATVAVFRGADGQGDIANGWMSNGNKRSGREPRPNRFCGGSMGFWNSCRRRRSRRMSGLLA